MKKLILSALLAISSVAAMAQANHKGELSVGYGYATREMVLNGFGSVPYKNYSEDERGFLNSVIAAGTFDLGNQNIRFGDRKRTGVIAATYRIHLFKTISLGLAVGFEREWAALQVDDASIRNLVTVGQYERRALTIAPEVLTMYKRLPMVAMYGFVGLGTTLVSEKVSGNKGSETINGNYFAFQITPFGIQVGRKLSGFAEVGFGYKGAINMGMSYKF